MSTNPLYKLTATADKTTAKMLKALKRAQDAVKLEILKATQEGRIATDAQERERLFKRIHAEYAKYGGDMAAAMAGLAEASAKAATDYTASSTGVDVHFSKPRLNALWSYLSPPNTRNLSAVFTDQMAEGAIKKLRGAFIDTYRQAQVEGWTANETSKQMRDSWDAVAHDGNTYRFVDKSGKPWENARYLQMLHRTTAQRVERDYTIDRMAEAGVTLYRISGASEECATCKAWAGQIIQMARPKKGGRNFPTYAQALAAGMFHPNCIHFIEPIDEDWGDDAEEIARQEAQKIPTEMSADEMQTRRDEIEKTRYMENDGISAQDAERAVTRDKLLDAIRTGVMDRELSQSVADGLTPADYDRLAASMPNFQKAKRGEEAGWRKGAQGGVVRIPRDATADDVLAIIAPKAPPPPPQAATPKPVKPVPPVNPVATAVPVKPVAPVKTGLQAAIESTWKSIEREPKEVFVVLNADGSEKFPRHNSGIYGGKIPVAWAGNMAGCTFVHNHPSGLIPERKGYGTSFSVDDIKTASGNGLAEMRAVSPNRNYWMKPGPAGWTDPNKIVRMYNIEEDKARLKIDRQVQNGRMTIAQANTIIGHLAWKGFAKKTGMLYGFERRSKNDGI